MFSSGGPLNFDLLQHVDVVPGKAIDGS